MCVSIPVWARRGPVVQGQAIPLSSRVRASFEVSAVLCSFGREDCCSGWGGGLDPHGMNGVVMVNLSPAPKVGNYSTADIITALYESIVERVCD